MEDNTPFPTGRGRALTGRPVYYATGRARRGGWTVRTWVRYGGDAEIAEAEGLGKGRQMAAEVFGFDAAAGRGELSCLLDG